MISLIHSLCLIGQMFYDFIRDKIYGGRLICDDSNVLLEPRDYQIRKYYFSKQCVCELKYFSHFKDEVSCRFDEDSGIKFFPPVYSQRYNVIKEIMSQGVWKDKLAKVLDIGCAEFNFFPFLKNLPGVEEILELDVNKQLLEEYSQRAAPLLSDHLFCRPSPLHVTVLCGNIAQRDARLLGCDAVIAIELIEHLYPSDLEEVPFTIFGFIRPSVAFITTPNADFNILFSQLHGFRHHDHKFEWSRVQFQDWATNITERFPEYEVTFQGIGTGPFGSDYLGCCSQMAVFSKKSQESASLHNEMQDKNDPENLLPSNAKYFYTVIADYKYPMYVDQRTEREKLQDSISSTIMSKASRIITQGPNVYRNCDEEDEYPEEEDYQENILIPLSDISESLELQIPESELREVVEGAGWKVQEVEGKLVVNCSTQNDQESSVPEDEESDDEWRKNVATDFDWEQVFSEKNEEHPMAQNTSCSQSVTSDWNDDDTQARACVDSGYPNSYSAQDKDFGNSVDLHGSSLEEDSGNDMEEEIENDGDVDERQQGILPFQAVDIDNQQHLNAAAAAVPELFFDEEDNQDENQDLVNNNRDNEGNNAEAVFGINRLDVNDAEIENGSESEESVAEDPSEEDSDLEEEKIEMIAKEENLMSRILDHVQQLPGNHAGPSIENRFSSVDKMQEDAVFEMAHEVTGKASCDKKETMDVVVPSMNCSTVDTPLVDKDEQLKAVKQVGD